VAIVSTSDAAPGYVGRHRERVEEALAKAVDFGPGCPERLAEAIRYAVLAPGKRLRPTLVLLAAEACGGGVDAALPAAVAVELVHTYSLVHDDLPAMDDDDLRRGRATCHRQFDEATAILVGDALQARAFEILASEIRPPERAAACCAELAASAGAEALVGGQADDLAAEFRHVGLEGLQSIHRRKTGALFRTALQLGAITAGASADVRARLATYGEHLGLAFQIVDDLLDVAGEEARMGKRVGKDKDRGKVTYPGLLGADESRRRAAALIDQATAAVAPFGERGQGLADLAAFVGRRGA
jgi:geranylgeranyl diphosphate synthase type II